MGHCPMPPLLPGEKAPQLQKYLLVQNGKYLFGLGYYTAFALLVFVVV
jgi:hypothetical protein